MDLSLSDTQQLIQDSVRDFVRGACDRDVLLKLDRDPAAMRDKLWPQMAELGWTGMAIPEQYGGTGNSMTDVAVLFEELGTGPVPAPLFSSAVLCARVLLEAADENTRNAWLPRIASGERIFALALTDAQYGWSADSIHLVAQQDGANFRLTGTKAFVHDAQFATDLLVAACITGGKGISLFHVDARAPGVTIRPLAGFLTAMSEVTFENVAVSGGDLIGAAGTAGDALDRARLAAIPVQGRTARGPTHRPPAFLQ